MSDQEELAKRLSKIESCEEAALLLKENGIETTAEELESLIASANAAEGELSDDELEAIAGGGACLCLVGGGGKKDDGTACGCYDLGVCMTSQDTCFCALLGEGYE